jgi:hypothetical protein
MIRKTAMTAKAKNLFSNLRCINTRKTNVDLIRAINRAIAIVSAPSEI